MLQARLAPVIRTRPLTAEDVPVCAAWVEEHPMFARYGLTAERLAASLAAALQQGDGLVVAEDDAAPSGPTPVGLAWYLPRGTFYHSAYLRLLVVSSRATGKGVGGALMDAVEDLVFRKVRDLFALVNTENVGAQRFYERRGYRCVGRLDDYVGPGLDEFIYRKRR